MHNDIAWTNRKPADHGLYSSKSWRVLVSVSLFTLGLAVSADAAVIASWTNVGNNYRFHISSDSGNITSLELSFAAAPGSTFQTDFADNLFDSDGLLAGFADSFLLFPGSVTSPGSTQSKSSTLLQASFTGFTPFASKEVAQLIVQGEVATPIPSTLDRDPRYMGKVVVETIAGDPSSRMEFPIQGNGDILPPVVTPRVINVGVLNIGDLLNLQLLATDDFSPPEDLVWSDLVYNGPGKFPTMPFANDPSLTEDGVFNWNPVGWKEGQHSFYATVTDVSGNNDPNRLVLTVNYLPESSSVWLLMLGTIRFVRVRRRQ